MIQEGVFSIWSIVAILWSHFFSGSLFRPRDYQDQLTVRSRVLFYLSVSFKKKKIKIIFLWRQYRLYKTSIGTSSFPEGEYQCVFVESKYFRFYTFIFELITRFARWELPNKFVKSTLSARQIKIVATSSVYVFRFCFWSFLGSMKEIYWCSAEITKFGVKFNTNLFLNLHIFFLTS